MIPAVVVFSAVPTLFSSDGEVDTGANRALYKHLAGLLDGLFVAGTTGEFPALDDTERLSLIELALAEAGPDRVIAHVGTPDARHAARLARAASALGATRLAAITPFYLPARPDEVCDHYRRIRDAAAGAELYAYIFPERTGLRVPPPLFAAVADAAGLAGGKLSGSAAGELAGYVAAAPGLRMFSGDDSNPAAAMRAGGAGVISGRSSAYPEVYAALVAALGSSGSGGSGSGSSDEEAVVRHQLTLDRIVGLGASIGRLKHALTLRGLGGTTARMAVDPPDASLSAAIAAEVAALLFHFVVNPRFVVNQRPGSRVQYSEVRRKRGAGPQDGSVIVRVPGSRPGESGAPDMWPGVSGAPGLIRCSTVGRAPGVPGK